MERKHAWKKGLFVLVLILAFACSAALADGGDWHYGRKLGSVQFASFTGSYRGWVDISAYGGLPDTNELRVRVISRNASVWPQARSSSRIGTVYNGDELVCRLDQYGNVIEQNGFYAVTYNGRDGWINQSYCVLNPFDIVLMEGNVPAYAVPDTGSPKVGSLDSLTRCTVIGFYNSFYVINLRTGSAFVPMSVDHYDTMFADKCAGLPLYSGVTTARTTLRSGPGADYSEVKTVNAGYQFTTPDLIDGWYVTSYPNDDDDVVYVYIEASAAQVDGFY